MSEIRLKDFILTDIPEKEQKAKPVKTSQIEYTFTLEYENDVDFIVRRVTARTDKSLVCIVSQGQIYIKDNKTGDVELITTTDQLLKFKSGMSLEQIPNTTKLIWRPFEINNVWKNGRYQDCVEVSSGFKELLKHKEAFKVLANKKLNPFKNSSVVYEYLRSPETFNDTMAFVDTVKLFVPNFNMNYSYFQSIKSSLMSVGLHLNTVNKYKEDFEGLGDKLLTLARQNNFSTIFADYHVDFITWMKWVLYTIINHDGLEISYYSTGFDLGDYVDYLRMQKEMYGSVKVKYPQYWLSEHQIMINKYNNWKTLRSKIGFELNQSEMNKYAYENEEYKVIIPMSSTEILDEAHQQQHCVASYIDRIAAGKTHILFIRKQDKPEESVLTVEVNTDDEICQVRGHMNRDYTLEEYKFMKEWADKTGLKLTIREKKDEEETEV